MKNKNNQKKTSINNNKTLVIDTSGHICPIPILKARKAMAGLEKNDTLIMTTTDQGAKKDMVHFCKSGNYKLEKTEENNKTIIFTIVK